MGLYLVFYILLFSISFRNIFPCYKMNVIFVAKSQVMEILTSKVECSPRRGTSKPWWHRADVQLRVAMAALPVPSAVDRGLLKAAKPWLPGDLSTSALSGPYSLLGQQDTLFLKDGLPNSSCGLQNSTFFFLAIRYARCDSEPSSIT